MVIFVINNRINLKPLKTNYKISIPQPCHENWGKMAPDETGRFCGSCAKSVVDFTGMKTPEIQDFFIKNQGQKVCGRFKSGQLDSIIIQIPTEVLLSQVQFHKIFLLALLVCMGTTLFSCQNSNGDKQKIGEVEIVDSTKQSMTLGIIISEKDTQCQDDTVKTKKPLEFVKPISEPYINGDVAIIPDTSVIKKEFYNLSEIETRPEFPGGINAFYEYIHSNFKLTDDIKKEIRRIIVSFIIEKDGSLKSIKIIRDTDGKLNNEIIRVLENSPKWLPGKIGKKAVRVQYSLPVTIKSQE